MEMIITDFSDGTLKTNYWQSEYAKGGIMYCAIHARVFHLLMPVGHLRNGEPIEVTRSEMATGKKVVVSKATNSPAWCFMFDDDSETPYCIFLDERQFSTLPAETDKGRKDVKVMAHFADGTTAEWAAEIE